MKSVSVSFITSIAYLRVARKEEGNGDLALVTSRVVAVQWEIPHMLCFQSQNVCRMLICHSAWKFTNSPLKAGIYTCTFFLCVCVYHVTHTGKSVFWLERFQSSILNLSWYKYKCIIKRQQKETERNWLIFVDLQSVFETLQVWILTNGRREGQELQRTPNI